MNKDQWTVVGLLVVLASLEIIRSQAVQGFFSGFFGQFGSRSSPTPANAPLPTTGGVTNQGVRGFPSPGGGHPS